MLHFKDKLVECPNSMLLRERSIEISLDWMSCHVQLSEMSKIRSEAYVLGRMAVRWSGNELKLVNNVAYFSFEE